MFLSFIRFVFPLLLVYPLVAQRTDTVRLMHYNLLRYGETGCMSMTTKNNYLRAIFGAYKPDILTVNEIRNDIAVINGLRNNTLGYNSAMNVGEYSNTANSEIVNALYYNADKFGYLGATAIKGNIRDIDVHRLYHKASTRSGDTTDIWCIVAHFKAADSDEYAAARAEAAKDVVNWLKRNPQVQRYLLSGDLNLYSSDEVAWKNLTGGSKPVFADPAGQLTGWRGASFARYHTQSPSDGANSCAAEGGMDNRFDFWLISPILADFTQPVRADVNSYRAYGNDGVSFDEALDCKSTTSIENTVCTALRKVSDHLPVAMHLAFAIPPGKNEAPFDVRVQGNPAQETLVFRITTPKKEPYGWRLYNLLGQVAAEGTLIAEAPETAVNAPIEGLSPAAYYLSVRNGAGQQISVPVIVVK